MLSIVSSSKWFAAICNPIGRPSFDRETGKESAGSPARLNGIVKKSLSYKALLSLALLIGKAVERFVGANTAEHCTNNSQNSL